MRIIFITILSLVSVFSLSAQRRQGEPTLEELPRVAMDTLATERPDVGVVIYTNNTWSYIFTDSGKLSGGEFDSHWTPNELFAYGDVKLAELPDEVELDMVDSDGYYHVPATGRIFSDYGRRGRRDHNGVDISLDRGDPVRAAFDGRVRHAKYNSGGFGNLVIIRHANGLETWYAHLVRSNVQAGDLVPAGAVIGYAGNTGRSSGVHLHFEMRYRDQSFDPERIFNFTTGELLHEKFRLIKTYFNINSRASDKLEEDEDTPQATDSLAVAGTEVATGSGSDSAGNSVSDGGSGSDAVKATESVYHTVRKGDTLYALSRKYGTTVKQLCSLNNITTKTTLRIGKKLRVK